ncbi:putative FAD dependent oxidoreductase [Aspergillus nomiae NRRL 13137]|uniref:Putative FAD dependent oxidoreductase n=1 Tax=Aspergillus nomiae NRRL (strain ATCC 15546 / NRRL 13137 / CBS 260.88 / M93) TaxID=1509407 RepID=A0A0L1J3F8_ASPN3|nr:putative FAD dependent oxidoreductase [Aspergillus nomiae NRRL 13137]KNG86205.1 putative FAD dependent oxidoreductase [Aspergillus nomiae NRRL 13137]
MAFVQALLTDPGIPLKDRQDALHRVLADPGIPGPLGESTSSFWLKDPHPELASMQSRELPQEADVVIIGSGITGASIARTLLEENDQLAVINTRPAVVMLEARDTCTGATGRNGGHILETAEEFTDWEALYGLEAAKALTRFRLAHLKSILQVADKYGLTKETQARKVEFLSVHFDEERWRQAVQCITRFKTCMPAESAEWKLLDKSEVPKVCYFHILLQYCLEVDNRSQEWCLPHAIGVVAGPAGALWPYKLVTGLLERLRQKHPANFLLETNTPATKVSTDGTSPLRYTVETPRGTLHARHVIHCTNAHVGHLVPELRGHVYPVRGQMSAQNPGSTFICQATEHSWLFNYDRGFDYLTQLPPGGDSGKKMMLGGGFAQGRNGGLGDLGIATDSELSLPCDIHLSGALSAVFGHENWGQVDGPCVEQMWTGNMGFSSDGLPWVGQLPSSVGYSAEATKESGAQWACCGFSGEGMVQAWLSGTAVAQMLLASGRTHHVRSDYLSWFPEQMLLTEERLKKAGLTRAVGDRASNL